MSSIVEFIRPNAEGYLHFDVTQGCTAKTLNGALFGLVGSLEVIEKSIDALGVSDVKAVIHQEKKKQVTGRSIEFVTKKATDKFNSWEDVKEQLLASRLSPVVIARVNKILNLLQSALERSQDSREIVALSPEEFFGILCESVVFSALIQDLNPFEITSTFLPLSEFHMESNLDWYACLLSLIEEVPTYECAQPAPYSEPLAVAMLKSIVNRFGPRGYSTLLKTGVGAVKNSSQYALLTRALWCEPSQVASRTTQALSQVPSVSPLLLVKGILGVQVDQRELYRRLVSLGAQAVFTLQVLDQTMATRTMLTAHVPHIQVDSVIEALLVTGEATEVATFPVEYHSLQRRIVTVALGSEQKREYCRVTEFVWGNKVIRVEPLSEDLANLVKATGFSQDAIRSDVLMAWRKLHV